MKSHSNLSKAVAIFLGCLISILLAEVVVRVLMGQGFQFVNYLKAPFVIKKNGVVIGLYDSVVGWKNSRSVNFVYKFYRRPRDKKDPNLIYSKVTYDENGFRRNLSFEKSSQSTKPLILALGDSFTFGGEVNDEETWPSHLETLSGNRVLNGGVSVYGLDQVVLSLEEFVKGGLRPKWVVLSITPLNIERVVRTHRIDQPTGAARPKPFFRIQGGQLVLHGVPIPELPSPRSLGFFRDIAGFSAFADLIFKKVAFDFWMGAVPQKMFPKRYKSGESSIDISCGLLNHVKQLSIKYQFIPIIFGQDYYQNPETGYQIDDAEEKVLSCSKNLGLVTLAATTQLKPIFESDYEDYITLFVHGGHMSNRGNLIMAKMVLELLGQRSGK